MQMQGFVYILKCVDGAYYVGSHKGFDVETRVAQHNSGDFPNAWTRKRRPVELVWSEHHDSIAEAHRRELQIKPWSRAKKEALIRGDVMALKQAAVSKSAPADPSKPRRFPRHS